MSYSVYGLIDPRNGDLRYVGKTTVRVLKRRAQHVESSKTKQTRCARWVRSLRRLGLKPEVVVFETHDTEAALSESERFFISYMRWLGCNLTNHTDGGEGAPGWRASDEERARQSAARRGKPGRPQSPETRSKIAAANTGRVFSDVTKARMSVAQSRRTYTDATKTKMSLSSSKRVQIADDEGNVYASVRSAAKAHSVSHAVISVAMKHGRRVRGVMFHRVKD
jgi:hypothetical protein